MQWPQRIRAKTGHKFTILLEMAAAMVAPIRRRLMGNVTLWMAEYEHCRNEDPPRLRWIYQVCEECDHEKGYEWRQSHVFDNEYDLPLTQCMKVWVIYPTKQYSQAILTHWNDCIACQVEREKDTHNEDWSSVVATNAFGHLLESVVFQLSSRVPVVWIECQVVCAPRLESVVLFLVELDSIVY